MKFDLTNFLELDTKALMAINGGGTCGGGSCSSGGSSYRGGGSCSSSSSYGGSCGGVTKGRGNCSSVNLSNGNGGGGNPLDSSGLPSTELKPTDKIEKAIIDVGDKKYVDGYRCDEYVEDILKNAGYDPKDYFVDNPSGKYVNDHISELEASKEKKYTTDASKLTEGAYVVFMADEQGTKDSHASILVVDSNGNAYMQDNSSTNNVRIDDDGNYIFDENGNKTYDGGTETTKGGNASYICSLYTGYENWYFQKLE